MTSPTLLSVRLTECDAHGSPPSVDHRPANIVIDIAGVTFEDLSPGKAAAFVGFSLVLSHGEAQEPVVEAAGTFRLDYEGHFPETTLEQVEFSSTRGLRDAWLPWTLWVQQTLVSMHVSPPLLPATVPSTLLDRAKDYLESWAEAESKGE